MAASAPPGTEADPVEPRPENIPAWLLYIAAASQWERNVMTGARTAIKIDQVWVLMDRHPITRELSAEDKWDVFERIQFIESYQLRIDAIIRDGNQMALRLNQLVDEF